MQSSIKEVAMTSSVFQYRAPRSTVWAAVIAQAFSCHGSVAFRSVRRSSMNANFVDARYEFRRFQSRVSDDGQRLSRFFRLICPRNLLASRRKFSPRVCLSAA